MPIKSIRNKSKRRPNSESSPDWAACGGLALVEAGTLPRTSSGKIRRAETRRLFEAHELTAIRSVWAWWFGKCRGAVHHTMRRLRRLSPR